MSEMTVIFALAAFFLQLKAIEHRGDPFAPAFSIAAWVSVAVTIALLLLT
jgi:hypothetical protein